MDAQTLKKKAAAQIAKKGQPLLVTRPADTQGGTPTTRTVVFVPIPLKTQGGAPLSMEAGFNVGESNPYNFVCEGDADVLENDSVDFYGFNWRLLNVDVTPLEGLNIIKECYGTREKPDANA